jgi:zinc protease
MAPHSADFTSSRTLPSPWRGPFEFVLENRLQVLFAQREPSPIVELRLILGGGSAADPDGKSGLAGFAAAMFGEGVLRAGNVQIGLELESLGAALHYHVMPDAAIIVMSALSANFEAAFHVFADALIHPEFKADDFERLRICRLALITRQRLDPFDLALQLLPEMLYGCGHAYARPWSGSGIERDVAAIACDDIHGYYATYLRPQLITLVAVGSCQPVRLRAQLEKTIGRLRAEPDDVLSSSPALSGVSPSMVRIVDRPGAPQAALAMGLRTVARNSTRAEALIVADAMLGGMFTSRLNLNLRESKGWTYGVRSLLLDARQQGFWLIRTALRSDCAAHTMAIIAGEIEKLAGRSPSSWDDFSLAIDYLVARIPSNYETCAQMADALAHAVNYRLPIRDALDFSACLRRLRPDDVAETCEQILSAGGPQWIVVGAATELSDQLRYFADGKIDVVRLSSAEARSTATGS